MTTHYSHSPHSKPSRLSYSMFLHMAPYWTQALRAYPQAVEVDPGSLAVETFARKFREAREAWREGGYNFPHDQKVGLAGIGELQHLMNLRADEITTSMSSSGTLLLGPRSAIKALNVRKLDARVQEAQGNLSGQEIEVTPDKSMLLPFLELMNGKAFLPRPTCFFLRNLTPVEVESIERSFPNIGLVEDEQEKGKWRIV